MTTFGQHVFRDQTFDLGEWAHGSWNDPDARDERDPSCNAERGRNLTRLQGDNGTGELGRGAEIRGQIFAGDEALLDLQAGLRRDRIEIRRGLDLARELLRLGRDEILGALQFEAAADGVFDFTQRCRPRGPGVLDLNDMEPVFRLDDRCELPGRCREGGVLESFHHAPAAEPTDFSTLGGRDGVL